MAQEIENQLSTDQIEPLDKQSLKAKGFDLWFEHRQYKNAEKRLNKRINEELTPQLSQRKNANKVVADVRKEGVKLSKKAKQVKALEVFEAWTVLDNVAAEIAVAKKNVPEIKAIVKQKRKVAKAARTIESEMLPEIAEAVGFSLESERTEVSAEVANRMLSK